MGFFKLLAFGFRVFWMMIVGSVGLRGVREKLIDFFIDYTEF